MKIRMNRRMSSSDGYYLGRAARDDPLQSRSPQLQRLTLLSLVLVLNINSQRHACFSRRSMISNVANNDWGYAKLGHSIQCCSSEVMGSPSIRDNLVAPYDVGHDIL